MRVCFPHKLRHKEPRSWKRRPYCISYSKSGPRVKQQCCILYSRALQPTRWTNSHTPILHLPYQNFAAYSLSLLHDFPSFAFCCMDVDCTAFCESCVVPVSQEQHDEIMATRFHSLMQKVWFDMLCVFTVIFLDSLGVMIRLQFSCDFFAPILSLWFYMISCKDPSMVFVLGFVAVWWHGLDCTSYRV